MKILVLSASPWSSGNSFGNSYSNIFTGIENIEIANISYSRKLSQTDDIVSQSYQVTTKQIINNLIDKNKIVGIKNYIKSENESKEIEQTKLFAFARSARWQILFWINDILWKVGKWKTKELLEFIDEFKPDLLFYPIHFVEYINVIGQFIKQYTQKPLIGYVSDDVYTLRQRRISPLYWIDRIFKRRKVKKTIEMCDLLYVISQTQKEEYEKIFSVPCKVLTKCADFDKEPPKYEMPDKTITFLYAGNMSKGRQKSLKLIAEAIERLNSEGYSARLDIYSGAPVSKSFEKCFNSKSSILHKPIPYSELYEIQKNTDVLIHVEGLSGKDRYDVHQSFSTKLVDFFSMGKCIFAVGTYDEASVKHLIDNDAAIVSQSKKDVYVKIKSILDNPLIINEYGEKAYLCGRKHHNKNNMQKMLTEDMNAILKKNK